MHHTSPRSRRALSVFISTLLNTSIVLSLISSLVLLPPKDIPKVHAQTPATLFSTQTPAVLMDTDTAAVELGMKFRSDVAGTVTGVRFYKGGSANGGTHIGSIWATNGTRLGQVTFSNETSSGWQTATFQTQISIQANTTYIVSYFAPQGRYSANNNFFSSEFANAPLRAPSSGSSGGNGVYRYGSSSGFPNQTFQESNYWVDVVFSSGAADTTSPTVSLTAPANGATISGNATVSATASDNVGVTSVTFLANGTTIGTDTTSPYSITWNTTSATNGNYTLTARAADAAGNTTTSSGIAVTVSNTTSDTTAPTAPTSLSATPQSSSQINLSWSASSDPESGIANYEVYRCQGTSCTPTTLIASPTGTTYNNTGLTANTTYRYRARAINGVGLPSGYSNTVSATTSGVPQSGARLQGSDVIYRGAFRLPPDAAAYGGNGLAFRPDGNNGNGSLFITGHVYGGTVGEFTIPTPVQATSYSALPQASQLQPFNNMLGSFESRIGGQVMVNGMTYYAPQGKTPNLCWTIINWYNATGANEDSLGCTDIPGTGSTVSGMWHAGPRNGEWHSDRTAGYLFEIPSSVAARFGNSNHTLCMGNHRYDGAFGGGRGPAIYCIDPWTSGSLPANGTNITAGVQVLRYHGFNEVGACYGPSCEFPDYASPDSWMGAEYINNGSREAIVIVGVKGLGPSYYNYGWFAPPYEYQMLFYDVNELAQVAAGQRTPESVIPYLRLTLPAPLGVTAEVAGFHPFGPLAYDEARQRIYIVQNYEGPNATPAIHVYDIQTSGSDDTTPPTTPTMNIPTVVSSSQINLSWTASTDPTVSGQTTSGVTGYRLERCEGSSCSNFTQIATPTGTTFNNIGLTANTTYRYRVLAVDGAGNASSYSTIVSATTPSGGDTTPPTISVTAPTVGTTVSGNTTISASASDNVGVTSVEFFVDGASKGTDTTSPFSISWDTENGGTHPCSGSHTHSLTARAVDAAGNQTTSSGVTVNMNNPSYCTGGRIVNVHTLSELYNAFATEQAGDTIIIHPTGSPYTLNSTALAIDQPNITIKGATGNRDDVVIRGDAMSSSALIKMVFLINNDLADNLTIKDLSMGRVGWHGIKFSGENNAGDGSIIDNVHIFDTFEQMLKVSDNGGASTDNVTVQNSLFDFTAGLAPQAYNGGIDAHRSTGWIVRNNTFRDIQSPSGSVTEHAIHFWDDTAGTGNNTIERNLIINCDRGIGMWLNTGGTIRNNMIIHDGSGAFPDVGIDIQNSTNVQIYNNTVYMAGSYPSAIEYRFTGTTGTYLANNLTNKAITARDGATGTVTNNITNAQASWFVNTANNLHLSSATTPANNAGISVSGLTNDFDGDVRPQGGGIDVGADEYQSTPTTLQGDLNSDGTVNTLDWGIMNSQWFTSNPQSDINSDGLVNSLDYGLLNNNWGMSS